MASSVKCTPCDRDITDRSKVIFAIENFNNVHCIECKEKLEVTVSADDVLMLPEPYRTDAMCSFTE